MNNFFKIINQQKKSIFYSLIIYVSLFIILIYTGINTPKVQEEIEFFFDFSQQEELLKQQQEKLDNKGDDLMPEDKLNIAVNKALKDNPLSNPYDFYNMPEQSDEYKEQLIKDALQDEYDEYANKEYKVDESFYENINTTKPSTKENKHKNNYQGATFVNYYLKDRNERRLIIPTYACEESGKVTVQIVVNRGGQVLKAELKNANNSAQCLINAALDAAKRSTFLRNNNAPEKQIGTISYTFKEQ